MIALLLFAAAVSHTPTRLSSTWTTSSGSACLTLTRSDVQAALGRRVGKPEEQNSEAVSTCDYATDRGRVTVTLQRLDRDPDIASEIAALQLEIEGASARPAPNFGPQAFYLDIAGAGTKLHIVRGRDYLLISVLGFGEAPSVVAAVERMARAALARW